MGFRIAARQALFAGVVLVCAAPPVMAGQAARQSAAAGQKVRVTGVVRDEFNAIPLPGVPVEVVGANQVVYTDVDGRYVLELAPGSHQVKVALDGYQERVIALEVVAGQRPADLNVSLSMAKFAETVTVTAAAPVDAITSSAAAQLIERKNAVVVSDNMGSQDMRENGDSDAASAMSRVTGLSVVDGQYVFVRGLGERYSNTTLGGAVIPSTEPDRKVVPLDMFPSALLDSVQVSKTFQPDKSAEFAGGLVQVQPLKFPSQTVFDLGYAFRTNTLATGESIPIGPLDGNDFFGFDRGVRAMPASFPDGKIVRQGIYTPSVGFPTAQINAFGEDLDNTWRPVNRSGDPGQNWQVTFGSRFGKLGVVTAVNHQYMESYVEEQRRFFRVAEGDQLEAVNDYAMQTAQQRALLGVVGNISYQVNSNHRLGFDNFYSHSGRDEGRFFEGPNTENNWIYRNYRLQFIQEDLLSNAATGEHFFQGLSNSRIDWRAQFARGDRDEPDLRETLYQQNLNGTGSFLLADESQSGFRMFNTQDDQTIDVQANWSLYYTPNDRPLQVKFGPAYIRRERDFQSRRFRFIPNTTGSGASLALDLSQSPEALFTEANIGPSFRFNEETRPTDAYDGESEVLAGYGMVDAALSAKARLVAGARVENFQMTVNSFDPFGLFVDTVTAQIDKTDFFPSVNFVYALRENTNLRLGYSGTTNRPEMRELAAFEFTDVVGNRAVRGNPNLERALIQNVDARWERFNGSRGILAASLFFKDFDKPIERVVQGGAQPIATFQNAESARNFGFEFEAGQDLGRYLFVSANYTWVDSEITLSEASRQVQTSSVRPLAGQSNNLFNLMGEFHVGGFQTRLLYNFFGDRISDVGANEAPDIIEQGRGALDLVFMQRWKQLNFRLTMENLNDPEYTFTQGSEVQRLFTIGRTFSFGLTYSWF